MYDANVNNTGCYFGLQTDVFKPGFGGSGKGVIFSRWGEIDLSDAKPVQDGWVEGSGHEGDFVGVRINYDWTTRPYQLDLFYDSSDARGDWYKVAVKDLTNSVSKVVGSLRFPKSSPQGISNGGGTWTEVYNKGVKKTPLPSWHVSVDSITADGHPPYSGFVQFSDNSQNVDYIYDSVTRKIHFFMGSGIKKEHEDKFKIILR